MGRHGLEDDFVIKQAFTALVPAFDPRPGRTNVPQIQDFEVPPPGTEGSTHSADHTPPITDQGVRLSLILKVPYSWLLSMRLYFARAQPILDN